MNLSSSQQRKVTYLIGILVLLIPIIVFGMPSAGVDPKSQQQASSGGVLAQMRRTYDLGESDLGDVDPSSATMNLVLLGLRGVAVCMLWQDLEKYRDTKDWTMMRSTTESIIRLQPHFEKVWDFNGWNLSYNTSIEWDDVRDRWYWVKEGGKFMQKGVARNRNSTDLRYRSGKIYQHKVGQSDEARFYRQYFKIDPDRESYKDGPDPDFNPIGRDHDNFLEAKRWFVMANESELSYPQHVLDRTLFRSHPARAQFDYASALQKDGLFGEQTRQAWASALDEWTQKYGQEEFTVDFRGNIVPIRLEMTKEDIAAVSKSSEEADLIQTTVDQYQKITNYRYWRTRGQCEAENQTSLAHQRFFEAGEEFKAQNLDKALELILESMQNFEGVVNKYPDLQYEDALIEECVMSVLLWQYIHGLMGEPLPDEFPLKTLYDSKVSDLGFMNNTEVAFRKRFVSFGQ